MLYQNLNLTWPKKHYSLHFFFFLEIPSFPWFHFLSSMASFSSVFVRMQDFPFGSPFLVFFHSAIFGRGLTISDMIIFIVETYSELDMEIDWTGVLSGMEVEEPGLKSVIIVKESAFRLETEEVFCIRRFQSNWTDWSFYSPTLISYICCHVVFITEDVFI